MGRETPSRGTEQREFLFDLFRRTADAHANGAGGWGIGLALVRAVAEAHGGTVNLDSLPETGTTFTLDLPLDARPFQQRPAQDADAWRAS